MTEEQLVEAMSRQMRHNGDMSSVLAVVREHDGAALEEAQASLALVSGNRDALVEDLAETQAALADARERIAVLEKALEWYADPVLAYAVTQAAEPRSAVHEDRVRRARAALSNGNDAAKREAALAELHVEERRLGLE